MFWSMVSVAPTNRHLSLLLHRNTKLFTKFDKGFICLLKNKSILLLRLQQTSSIYDINVVKTIELAIIQISGRKLLILKH